MDQCHGNVIYLGSLSTFLAHPGVSLLLKIPCALFTWCFFQMFDQICAILSVVNKIFASRNNFGFADIAAWHLFLRCSQCKVSQHSKTHVEKLQSSHSSAKMLAGRPNNWPQTVGWTQEIHTTRCSQLADSPSLASSLAGRNR